MIADDKASNHPSIHTCKSSCTRVSRTTTYYYYPRPFEDSAFVLLTDVTGR